MDPSQIGRFQAKPAVNVILDSLGVAEETPVAWENAEDPRPRDIVALKGDYALRAGDLVQISIFELYQEGVPLIGQFLVSETGKISIPEVGIVQAAGLTETQLEEEIKKILSPGILKEPSVTVTLVDSQQRTFSVIGNGVPRSGRYLVPRYDFRLTDALAIAGGPMQFNVSYVYVSRKDETLPAFGHTDTGVSSPSELELIEPGSQLQTQPLGRRSDTNPPAATSSQPPAAPASQSDIATPAEPAEKFELERQMLDMIAPSANSGALAGTDADTNTEKVSPPRLTGGKNNTQTAKPAPTQTAQPTAPPSPAPKSKGSGEAAKEMPHGFRLLVPPKPAVEKAPPAAAGRTAPKGSWDLVYSPVVLPEDANKPGRAPAPVTKAGERIEWVFRDGKWVPVAVGAGEQPAAPPSQETRRQQGPAPGRQAGPASQTQTPSPSRVALETAKPGPPPVNSEKLPPELEWGQGLQTRLLRIPTDRLVAGDPRYNVVIKPGDTIFVPVDIIGEFYIMGNVNRTGAIPITGRPMTLKMAIAAAGGLGPLAWPKSVEVVRRIGKDKEEIVMVDLDKIANGEQPDFFVRPNDLINVGTEPFARWRAVLRNAFRAAYGFGFVYDRNFGDADYGKGLVLPHWL
jgi:protein involved in polysaccharide export with SLBB domain